MTKADYKEMERLNREMNIPLQKVIEFLKSYFDEPSPNYTRLFHDIIILHNNRLRIKELLEKEEPVKTKYKDQKLFP